MDLPIHASNITLRFDKMVVPGERKPSTVLAMRTFNNVPRPTQCINNASSTQTIHRRSADYQPTVWHYDYIQSLNNPYNGEEYIKENAGLKEEIRMMLCKVDNKLDQLELIDIIQRLGIDYHFTNEISNILKNVYNNNKDNFKSKKNLYETSLEFRLLRQHGYEVSSDIFYSFHDEIHYFESQSDSVKGMLSLYEASFLSLKDEPVLDEAMDLSSKILRDYESKNRGNNMSILINHALEIPLHWRVPRWEARWFIDFYETSDNMNPTLLQFAKLDFNMIQTIHQEELKSTSRWWNKVGLANKLSFFRDRLVENFFWCAGMNFKPQLEYFRIITTRVNCLITTFDDIYDVHGTLEELELFTQAVDRWDLSAMEGVPSYMKICFLALHNMINEVAFETLKENDNFIIPYLRKAWTDLCKSYLQEAKWYHSGYTPRFEEYIENAWVTIGATVILVHAYFLVPNPSRNEDLGLEEYPHIVRFSSMLLRLANDLGSSQSESKTGDVPKAVECYMNEYGTSEADAREHVKREIFSTWKMMNNEVRNSNFNQDFIDINMNLARASLFFYQNEEGYTIQDSETKNRISSLIMQPILMRG